MFISPQYKCKIKRTAPDHPVLRIVCISSNNGWQAVSFLLKHVASLFASTDDIICFLLSINMSFVQNPRVECGKILQNHNGQYFFVCSTCELEFVTLSSFLNHQNDAHDTKEFEKQSDELTIPFTKNVGRKIKESIMGSKDLGVSFTEQKNAMREIKDDKDSSDSMDDCAEHVNKIKALLRSVSNSEPRRTILVSPKAKKPARNFGKTLLL